MSYDAKRQWSETVAEDLLVDLNDTLDSKSLPEWLHEDDLVQACRDNISFVWEFIKSPEVQAASLAIEALKEIVSDGGMTNLGEDSKQLIRKALEVANVKMEELTTVQR